MTSCRTETGTAIRTGKMDHSIVFAITSEWRRRLSACVKSHGGHLEHILWWIHNSVHKLMLRKFPHLCFFLFDCFVCRQNVTCLKRFTRYTHYAGEVEDDDIHSSNWF